MDNAAVSVGRWHTLILKSDGRVFVTGRNAYGQLGRNGLNATSRIWVPVEISSLGANNQAVSAGELHSVYLKIDGKVFAAGYNAQCALGDGTSTNRFSPVRAFRWRVAVACRCTVLPSAIAITARSCPGTGSTMGSCRSKSKCRTVRERWSQRSQPAAGTRCSSGATGKSLLPGRTGSRPGLVHPHLPSAAGLSLPAC